MVKTKPPSERFWDKVTKATGDDCWEWSGWKREGYGRLSSGGVKGPDVSAHRVSWEIHFGPIPDGLFVCHTCDNRGCVRPDHLFLGSNADNMADMVRRGRSPRYSRRGDISPKHKLLQRQVDEIRFRLNAGERQCDLVKEFNVSPATICMIKSGKRWLTTPYRIDIVD